MTTWVSQYQKGKNSLDLNEARDDRVCGCSGISWAICKQSAPRSRQITTSTPHNSIFTGRMLIMTTNQQCQSTICQYKESQFSHMTLLVEIMGNGSTACKTMFILQKKKTEQSTQQVSHIHCVSKKNKTPNSCP